MLLGTRLQFDGSNHCASFRNISGDASSSSSSPLFHRGDIFATSLGLWRLRTDSDFDESPIISNPKPETGWTAAALWDDQLQQQGQVDSKTSYIGTLSSIAGNEWSLSPNNIQGGGGSAKEEEKEQKKIHFLFVAGCGGKVLAWRLEGYHHLLHHPPSDLRVSQSNEKEEEEQPTTLAEDLGEISYLAFNRSGDFLAVGLSSHETWVLRLLKDEQQQQILEVEHYATLDTGEGGGRLLELHFVGGGGGAADGGCGVGDGRNLLLTVGQCQIKLWCTKSLECICKASAPSGHHPITSASVYGDIIALGNSNGDIHLLSLVAQWPECNIVIRRAGSINVSTSMRDKSVSVTPLQDDGDQEIGRSNVPWVSSKVKRRSSSYGSTIKKNSSISKPTVLPNFEDNGFVQVACGILDMTFVCTEEASVPNSRPQGQPRTQNKPFSCLDSDISYIPTLYLVVGTNIGMALINVRSKEITSIIHFAQMLAESVFASMASSMKLSFSQDSANVNCIAVRTKQEDRKKNYVTFSAALSDGNGSSPLDISVIASTAVSEHSFLHHKNLQKPQSILPLSERNEMTQPRRTKSSGYGNLQRRQMFLPKINPPRSHKKLHPTNSNFCDGLPELPSLEKCEGLNGGPSSRARWNKRPDARNLDKTPLRQSLLRLDASSDSNYPPSTLCSHLKIWSTDGAKTRLCFSPTSAKAEVLAVSSSCDNTIQIFHSKSLESKKNRVSSMIQDGDLALSGHAGEVRSMDFSHRGDLLATAGNDRLVKIWDWRRSNVPKLCVSSTQGYEKKGTGHAYSADMKRHVENPEMIFPDSVIKSQFYYVDQFLLSASSNTIFVHQLGVQEEDDGHRRRRSLPSKSAEENWYKLSKTFQLDGCKHVTDFSAVNQFYSFLVLCACSDRSLRVLDLNRQTVCHEISSVHQRPVHCLIQPRGAASSADHNAYNLFATAAPGDGAKLWDLRTAGGYVQRFDWPGSSSGRVASGLDISPCLRFLATGSDDGGTYVFDIRRNVVGCGSYLSRLQGQRPAEEGGKSNNSSSSSSVAAAVTDVAFSPCLNFVASGTQDGDVLVFRR